MINTLLLLLNLWIAPNPPKSVYDFSFKTLDGKEVKLSTEFAKSIGAELGLLHIQAPEDLSLDPGLIKQMIKRISDYPLKLHFKNWLLKKTLMENIQLTIEELKPSMLILFTDQDKNLVEKLLFPSFTREYVLLADIPLLIYKK